jgi:hypothetical protein
MNHLDIITKETLIISTKKSVNNYAMKYLLLLIVLMGCNGKHYPRVVQNKWQ